MRGGILCGLLLGGIVLIYTHMNQEDLQFIEPPRAIVENTSDSEKKKSHSINMTVPEKNDLGNKLMAADDEPDENESKYGKLPGVLQGTRMDGELLADADGMLIIDSSIRKRFDYFLSAVSEEGLETAIGRIEENIVNSLPPGAADEALGVLNSYINYKKGLQNYFNVKVDFTENLDQVEGIRKMMEKRMELRRQYMAPEVVDIFFGDQELYDAYSLKRLEIYYNESLSSEEKQNELIRLKQTRPEKYRS